MCLGLVFFTDISFGKAGTSLIPCATRFLRLSPLSQVAGSKIREPDCIFCRILCAWGLLKLKETLTYGDQWKEGQSAIETHVYARICLWFPLTVVASFMGRSPSCARQLHSREKKTVGR